MVAEMAKVIRICPSCGSKRMVKYDTYKYGGRKKARYQCQKCGRLTIYPLIQLVAERKKKKS
jgi:transposase-like protein